MKGRKGKVLSWKELPIRWVVVLAIVAVFLPSLSAQAVTSTTTNDVISQMRYVARVAFLYPEDDSAKRSQASKMICSSTDRRVNVRKFRGHFGYEHV